MVHGDRILQSFGRVVQTFFLESRLSSFEVYLDCSCNVVVHVENIVDTNADRIIVQPSPMILVQKK